VALGTGSWSVILSARAEVARPLRGSLSKDLFFSSFWKIFQKC
jgi:hypothetical protein